MRKENPEYAEAVDAEFEMELLEIARVAMHRTMLVQDGGQPDDAYPVGVLLKSTAQGLTFVDGTESLHDYQAQDDHARGR